MFIELQRLLERKIRQYKNELKENEVFISNAPKETDTSQFETKRIELKSKISNAQSNVRELVNQYPNLERQYRRESIVEESKDLKVHDDYNIPPTNRNYGKLYDKSFQSESKKIDREYVDKYNLKIKEEKNILKYEFNDIEIAKKYVQENQYLLKESARLHLKTLEEYNKVISSLKTVQENFVDIPISPYLLDIAKPNNKNTLLELSFPEKKQEGSYCHMVNMHSEQYLDSDKLEMMKKAIKEINEKDEINVINKNYGTIRYGVTKVVDEKNKKAIFMAFDKIDDTLILFNIFYKTL